MSTLNEIVALVAADLQDPDHLIWTDDDLTNLIRRALATYAGLNPRRASALIEAVSGQQEYDIAALGALAIYDVWHPFDSDKPTHPPQRVAFALLDDATLYIKGDAPTEAGQIRLLYLAPHTISGLDGATETTLDTVGTELIVLLATASAAMQRAQAAIGKVTLDGRTPEQLLAWAAARQAAAQQAWEALRHRLALAGDARVSWELTV
jgi:hypothetical protein